ncbi:NAD(P)/FAD-dependent oxidoreductase [Kistimonas asteriae]|uniref:NAD(P)/FAD-dependent oxidoreductase n=1 Tax=Kistimonas asteriae TaxID=517724 RepID=UPI001BA57C4A|nr:FAD-binding oxidoreductase [Kistimonas asteriae]
MPKQHADIIIIGAGIAGAGLAAMIAGDRKVIILEAEDHPGYHSTGRSAAVLIQNYGNTTIRALTRISRSYLEHPPEGLNSHALLHTRGCLFTAAENNCDDIKTLMQQAEGLTAVTAEEAQAMIPALKPDAVHMAAYEAAAADIDVAALHQGWLRMAKMSGAELNVRERVKTIKRTHNLWQLETDRHAYTAPVIVNAAGAWADPVARMAGVKPAGIVPKRRSIAILPEPAHYHASDWPIFGNVNDTWYCKPETGRLLVSPADEDPVEPMDAYVDDLVLAEGLHRFEQAVDFPVSRIEGSWAGLRSFAPDNTPVVGFAPDADGFFWLAGQGGYGIQTAPAISQLAAVLITGARPASSFSSDILASISPNRFIENRTY